MYLKILWKMEHMLFGANAPFSIIFSKVFKTKLNFFLNFQCCFKIAFEISYIFENFIKNGAIALLEQMLNFT